MTFRRLITCLLVLFSAAALTWLQDRSFAQNVYPGGNPGPSQPVTTGVYNPPYQQPTAGVQTGGYSPTGPAAGATVPGAVPPTNHMMDRPMGMLPGGPQPGNPPQVQNARQILPPPIELQVNKEKQDIIDRFLTVWQEQSTNIEALDYEFTCREYTSFGVSETYGRVKFQAPDKGMIEIDSELINGKKSFESNKKMKIICTGDAVYEFNDVEKKLTKFIIPAEERGKGVMDSPLMILAGANPRELQERFYLDVIPSPESLADCLCLQAWPKWLEDSKEFKSVTVAIHRQTFHARVLLLYEPGGEGCKGYEITNTKPKNRIFPPQILPGPKPQDDFAHNVIVNSKPKNWMFETKNDFLPEASGQQMVRQPYPGVGATTAPVSPPYGNPSNVPGNIPINNTAPGIVPQGQPGVTPQGRTGMGMPYNGVNSGVNLNNPPRTNNQIAMPPQGYTNSQSVFR